MYYQNMYSGAKYGFFPSSVKAESTKTDTFVRSKPVKPVSVGKSKPTKPVSVGKMVFSKYNTDKSVVVESRPIDSNHTGKSGSMSVIMTHPFEIKNRGITSTMFQQELVDYVSGCGSGLIVTNVVPRRTSSKHTGSYSSLVDLKYTANSTETLTHLLEGKKVRTNLMDKSCTLQKVGIHIVRNASVKKTHKTAQVSKERNVLKRQKQAN